MVRACSALPLFLSRRIHSFSQSNPDRPIRFDHASYHEYDPKRAAGAMTDYRKDVRQLVRACGEHQRAPPDSLTAGQTVLRVRCTIGSR